MTVTASSGSPRVSPQLYDTLPLSSVRQAEQQDRFPDGGELGSLITFFRSGRYRITAAQRISANADAIVAQAANRIFAGGTPLSYLDRPLSIQTNDIPKETSLASDQVAFASSVRTFTGGSTSKKRFGLSRLLEGTSGSTDVRVVLPNGFSPISVARYGPDRMRKSLRDMGWFLRYVGYAIVAGDPSILAVNTRGLKDILEKGCSIAATNVALQEMRAAAAELFSEEPETRQLVIDCFNVLLKELAIPTPSALQRLGSSVSQGLQLPAIYALASEGAQRFIIRPKLSGKEKAEIIRAAYRQVFERDIVKAYSQKVCPVEATQVAQGQISMREFIRALGRSKEYRRQFYGRFTNSRVLELAYRHFLGRGISSIEEFRRGFAIVSKQGLGGLIDSIVNSMEYAQVFGEETVPYLRDLGEEAQESAGWGSNRKLFRFSAPFEGAPQYITLYASYRKPLADQHPYGGCNDPLGLNYGAIFPSSTSSVTTRPSYFGYDTRRILLGNGMLQPGQMNSTQFRNAQPRRVGPKVIRLKQIATGGSSVPSRGGQPSSRNTESSTQSTIKAVYVQVLGNIGYAGEQIKVEEIKLENGDLSLREFVRQVARSQAFRRRYWDGLYITKAIEVIHRRLLGRPTFGRWEIDALFSIAASSGFYGIVDALINGAEYNASFGEDTVPYERFITPTDLQSRRVPSLKRTLNPLAYANVESIKRPDLASSNKIKTTGDLTQRNLPGRGMLIKGSWSAKISDDGQSKDLNIDQQQGPESIRQAPAPQRRWRQSQWQSRSGNNTSNYLQRPLSGLISGWTANVSNTSLNLVSAKASNSSMTEALKRIKPDGFIRRSGISDSVELRRPITEEGLIKVIESSYRQLLNRVPFASERLVNSESMLRDERLDVAEFIAQIASSDLFQNRLNRLSPIRGASVAYFALLGRAGTPDEVTRFLSTRAKLGQKLAIEEILSSTDYKNTFGRNRVPSIIGLATLDGISLRTVNRTASLYRGAASFIFSNRETI
uniref:Phycobiliprotein ApcE n=1 Tax=Paulinella chromatophora TaxID=39717 RepID=B1X3X8_PAUCH|nr:anchor polypeptide LCM [Paulinella chromatophora]ACB42647.1 anchor polypeptide LCM [Paulinella chromatophora]